MHVDLKHTDLNELMRVNDERKKDFSVGDTAYVLYDIENSMLLFSMKNIDEVEIVDISNNVYMPIVCKSGDRRFCCSADIVFKTLDEAEDRAAEIESEKARMKEKNYWDNRKAWLASLSAGDEVTVMSCKNEGRSGGFEIRSVKEVKDGVITLDSGEEFKRGRMNIDRLGYDYKDIVREEDLKTDWLKEELRKTKGVRE